MLSRIFTFLSVFVVGLCSVLCGANENIRVETYQGKAIAPYTKDIVALANDFYHKHPYLYEGTDADDTSLLESYAKSDKSVMSITFDGNKVIGFVAGMPLNEASSKYQQPLVQKGYDPKSVFYLSEMVLQPEYQGKGFGKKMMGNVEKAAKTQSGISKIAVAVIDESSVKTPAPDGYVLFEERILKDLGYQQKRDVNFVNSWTNVGDRTKTPHTLIYWIKSVN